MENSIIKNAVFNVLYKALSVIFPLIIVSYASKKLGATGIGEVSSAQNIVTYFTMFAALGIPSYGVRSIAQSKKNRKQCNKIFTELFVINFCSTCICTFFYFILLKYLKLKIIELNYIFSLLIILNIFNVEWVYEGFEKYQYIAIRSFIVKGISLFLMYIFVKNKTDLFLYAIIVCFGIVGNYLLNIVGLSKYVNFNFKSLEIKKHLKVILAFLGSVVAIELYSLVDITMLTYSVSFDIVGCYSNASKIVKMLANTITAIGAVMLPRLSLCFSEGKESDIKILLKNFLIVILTLAIPSTIGICFVSKEIVFFLFGEEFKSSVLTIIILSPLIILMPLSGGIFTQILLTSKNEKKYLFCVTMGAILNIILNFIFIHFWKHNGAALASVITEFLINIVMFIFSIEIINIKIDKIEILKIGVASSIMFILLIILEKIFTNNYLLIISLLLKISLSIILYVGSLYLMKQKIIFEAIKKINIYLKKI